MDNDNQAGKPRSQAQQPQENTRYDTINTGGGAHIEGNVNTGGGNFVGGSTIEINGDLVINVTNGQLTFTTDKPQSTEELQSAFEKPLQSLANNFRNMGSTSDIKRDKYTQECIEAWREVLRDDQELPQAMMTLGDAEVIFGLDNTDESVMSLQEAIAQNLVKASASGTGSYKEMDIKLEKLKLARGRKLRIKLPCGTLLYPDEHGHRNVTPIK